MLRNPEFRFVQVGAFDGRTGDPIHEMVVKHKWSGVLAEPRRHYFEQLRATYADNPRVTLRQVAVFAERGRRRMYSLPEDPNLPEWTSQVAAFDRAVVLATKLPVADRVVAEDVDCVTLSDLMDEAGGPVDLLQIDAEGYDDKIVSMIDWAASAPAIVHFEHHALSRRSHADVVDLLVENGYRVALDGRDTVAAR